MKSQVPSGQVNHPAQLDLSESAREHFDWILANLDRVNQVLATAMKHLRLLYGDAYLSTM